MTDRRGIEVTFLGTGTSSGVPMPACSCAVCRSDDPRDRRLRSSVMIETAGKTLVIDSGPDFRQQMLRHNVMKLDAVLFTHEHKDHIAGLDDVRGYNFSSGKPMDIYATSAVLRALEREFHYIFHDYGYPGVPRVSVHEIEDVPFTAAGVAVMPVPALHYRLPVLGFRIGDFTYLTDANHIDDSGKEKIRGSRIIVLSALRKEKHLAHFTLSQALELLEELKPEQGYFTHISHQLGLHSEIQKELPSFAALAYDGLSLTL